jgi:hypothetical protein
MTVHDTGQPVYYSTSTHGVNLKGVRLQNTNLAKARLIQANLSKATLFRANLELADCHDSKFTGSFLLEIHAPGADFTYCDLRNCYLIDADLRGANLSHTRLQGADLTNADLCEATLCHAKLTDVDFTGANLRGANLFGASLSGTFMKPQQIGDSLIQESRYYRNQESPHSNQDTNIENTLNRYVQAVSIYRALKSNFLSIGDYDAASWAYVKERRMRKKTHWPPVRIRDSYPREFNRLRADGLRGSLMRLHFYIKHFSSFLFDWVLEITSKYGEQPSLTLYWAVAVVLIFAILFQVTGGVSQAHTWLDYLNYSLGAFVTVTFEEFEATTDLVKTLTSIEALLGICILALLMFALGNRIKRY